MAGVPIGRRQARLTYHTKTGKVSLTEIAVPDVTHIARALREAVPHDDVQAEFFAAMAEACDELVRGSSSLDRHNVEVVKEIPWMRRLASRP